MLSSHVYGVRTRSKEVLTLTRQPSFRSFFCSLLILSGFTGCADQAAVEDTQEQPWSSGVFLPAEPYEEGDPDKGWYSLTHDGYMSCGLPWSLWNHDLAGVLAKDMLVGDTETVTLADRAGNNRELPHMLTAFTTTDGVDVVNLNCLQCHGGFFNGELVVGLGSAAADFTGSQDQGTDSIEFSDDVQIGRAHV
jgi:hypothetical protein